MKNTIVILLLAISVAGYSQKVKLVQGNLKPLKGETSIKIEFTYDNMIVGKDLTEQEYLKDKKADKNAKDPGKGDVWEKTWFDDRGARFEPQFRELFAKYSGLTTAMGSAKYTLIFHTTRTEPGWNVGVMRVPARIDAEAIIVETQNKNNVIAKFTVMKAPGRDAMGFDFEVGVRLQEAYAKSGKSLGKQFIKLLK